MSAHPPGETLVFVYGTLQRGQRNDARMEDAVFVGGTATAAAGFRMIECESTSWPGRRTPSVCRQENGTRIRGELFAVGRELLGRLDRFEQVGEHYQRAAVALDGGVKAFIYLHKESSPKRPCPDPLWITHDGQSAGWAEPRELVHL